MDDTRAIYWIANQIKYINEAIVSARSVKTHMPDVTTVLGYPGYDGGYNLDNFFDEIYDLPVSSHDQWFLNSTHYQVDMLHEMFKHGIKQAIYLDTDTYVCAPVHDLFDLVGYRYTIAGAHAPARRTGKCVENVPMCFPEINIGVNPIQVDNGRSLFEDVYNQYVKWAEIYGNNDQLPMRDILWTKSRYYYLYILPPEYNMRLFPAFVARQVKILHGRSSMSYDEICRKINESQGMRLWYQDRLLSE